MTVVDVEKKIVCLLKSKAMTFDEISRNINENEKHIFYAVNNLLMKGCVVQPWNENKGFFDDIYKLADDFEAVL